MILLPTTTLVGSPGYLGGKESTCNAGDQGSIPGLGRSLGGGHGNHSSILTWRILMDRGAWWATVHGGHKKLDMAEQLTISLSLFYIQQR